MKVIKLDQAGSGWKKWRRDGIGGSDASTLMGCGFISKEELIACKNGTWEVPENDRMARGKRLEPQARKMYEELTGIKMTPVCVAHDSIPWLRASLDGISECGKIILEIKCPKSPGPHCKALNKKIPDYYYPQVQHQMAVTDLEVVHYWSYTDSEEFEPRDRGALVIIHRDEPYIKQLLEKERIFHESIKVKKARTKK